MEKQVRNRIPPEYIEVILEKAGAGQGCRVIAAWLAAEHGVKVSHETVSKVVRTRAQERAVAAKSVARAFVAKSVKNDMGRVDLFIRKALRIARVSEGDAEVWCKVSKELRLWLEFRAKLAGLDEPDHPAASVVFDDETIRRMAREVAGG